VALLLAGNAAVRADHIDNELRLKAPSIMKQLEAEGYKNVGIFKFQVIKGNNPPTFTGGKINSSMATRLENALIMADKADAPIGITRGASAAAAAKDNMASYLTRAGREKLFTYTYPLAWGSDNVMVDAFLTGTVTIAPDMKTTKITIQAFDKKNPELRDMAEFTVDTDLAILRDTNQNFVVARRSFNAWANADDPDEELNKTAVKEAVRENKLGSAGKLSVEDMKDFLDFTILFDGQPVNVTPEGFLAKPAAGQTVTITVKAKVKLGLLLRVNGVNTLNKQRDEKSDLNDYSWWVLDPNVEYTLRGFYKDGQVETFVAKAAGDIDLGTEVGENAQRHGTFDFDVFVDPTAVVNNAVPLARKPNFSYRTVTARSATFDDMKDMIRNSMQSSKKGTSRAFIVGGAVENQTLQTTTFDGRHVGGLTINYLRGAK